MVGLKYLFSALHSKHALRFHWSLPHFWSYPKNLDLWHQTPFPRMSWVGLGTKLGYDWSLQVTISHHATIVQLSEMGIVRPHPKQEPQLMSHK